MVSSQNLVIEGRYAIQIDVLHTYLPQRSQRRSRRHWDPNTRIFFIRDGIGIHYMTLELIVFKPSYLRN